jgi:WD40 repeat protein
VNAVTFSPDGKRIATGGEDGSVGLFDAQTGERQLILPGHDFLVTGLAFTRDGRRLVSASPDGVVRVWALDLDELIEIASDEVKRRLTDDECRQYLHQPHGCA